MTYAQRIALIRQKFTKPMPDDLSLKEARSEVWRIAGPSLSELFLVQLCSMADTIMVGRLGSWAIASVGYCTQPRFLMLSTFMALSSGSTALIARFKGAEDQASANTVLRQGLIMTFILGIVMSIIGFTFSRQMIIFMGAESEITIRSATSYMQIQMIGFLFNAMTLSISAALRGIGRTRISMVYNMVANIVNVILNWIMIYGHFGFPRMEVAGASLATIIGQFVACVMAFIAISRKTGYLRLQLKQLLKVDLSIIKRILKIGLPAMVEQLIMRAGMLIYTLTVTSLGEVMYATHQIAASILTMSFMNGQAFGIAATSLTGQSLGRKRKDHAVAYTQQCRRFAMTVALFLSFTFFFGGKWLVMLFSTDIDIIQEGAKVLMVVAFLQPLQSSQLVTSGSLRGAGDTKLTAVMTFVGILLVRPVLSFIFIQYIGMGLMGAWLAMSLDQSVRSLLSILRFNSGKWADIKV